MGLIPCPHGRWEILHCLMSNLRKKFLKGFCAGNSITEMLSPCSQGKGIPPGARGEERGYQSMGASFSSAQPLPGHGAGGTVPGATGIAGCSQSIPAYLQQDNQGKKHGAMGLQGERPAPRCGLTKRRSRNAIRPWEVGTITRPCGNPSSSGVLLLQEPLPCPSHFDSSPLALLC